MNKMLIQFSLLLAMVLTIGSPFVRYHEFYMDDRFAEIEADMSLDNSLETLSAVIILPAAEAETETAILSASLSIKSSKAEEVVENHHFGPEVLHLELLERPPSA
jgi:hypothetical protein